MTGWIHMTMAGLTALVMALSSGCQTKSESGAGITPPGQGIHLLNGKDLDRFYTFLDGFGGHRAEDGTFAMTNGMLRVSGQHPGYLATKAEYADYRLVAEFKWGNVTWAPHAYNARRCGIVINTTGPDGLPGKGLECELVEGGTGDVLLLGGATLAVNGAATLPGTARFDRPGREGWKDQLGFRGTNEIENPCGEWNTVEIINTGGNLQVRVNGHTTVEGTGAKPEKGKIWLQSAGAELFFRRLDLYPARSTP